MPAAGGWRGRGVPQPARVSSHSHVQPGTVELLPSPRPLAVPKPDAWVTLALPSPTSSVLCWHTARRCLWAPDSAPSWRETGPAQLPPTSLPPGAPFSLGSPSCRTPGTPQGAQPAGSHSKENVLRLTCKAAGGSGPACPCLALAAWRPAWVSRGSPRPTETGISSAWPQNSW